MGSRTEEQRLANNAYMRKWAAEHREQIRERHRKYDREKYPKWQARLAELKSKPCMDCGVSYPPCVMDFDHRPGETKLFGINDGWSKAKARVDAEVAKCDLVCSNCHRLRTQARIEERNGL